MPKRVIDFDAMWASDKIAACAEWAQFEYAWLYGLADCNGCFELTNLRVIWGRVAAVRKNLSLERLAQVFDEFHDKGLFFRWSDGGKRYGHWTGSDVPGRLPPPSWRNRLERLAPPVPRAALEEYVATHMRRSTDSPHATTACGTPENENPRPKLQDGISLAATPARDDEEALERRERGLPERSLPAGRQASLGPDEKHRDSAQDDNVLFIRADEGGVSKNPQVPAQDVGKDDFFELARGCSVFKSPRGSSTPDPVGKDDNPCLEAAQAQGLDLGLDLEWEGKRGVETHNPSLERELEELLRTAAENSQTGKSKSVCESASLTSGEGKNKQNILAEEINTKPIPVEEETANSKSRSFVEKNAPLDDNVRADAGDNARAGAIVGCHPERSEESVSRATIQATGDVLGAAAGSFVTENAPQDDNVEVGAAVNARVGASAETLAEIWEQERGSLPELRAMTPERVARCRERLRNAARDGAVVSREDSKSKTPHVTTTCGAPDRETRGAPGADSDSAIAQFLDDFREAVRRAAATPFLCGSGPAGWRANFDWIIANDTNYVKVLEGRYDSGGPALVTTETPASHCAAGYPSPANRLGMTGTAAAAGRAGGTRTSVAAPAWAAERAAREESVRRELRVGVGPSASANGAAMRADVVERFRHRGKVQT